MTLRSICFGEHELRRSILHAPSQQFSARTDTEDAEDQYSFMNATLALFKPPVDEVRDIVNRQLKAYGEKWGGLLPGGLYPDWGSFQTCGNMGCGRMSRVW